MAYDKDNGTAAIYREPMPPRKSCTSYHVFKILAIIYAVIFFVSIKHIYSPQISMLILYLCAHVEKCFLAFLLIFRRISPRSSEVPSTSDASCADT